MPLVRARVSIPQLLFEGFLWGTLLAWLLVMLHHAVALPWSGRDYVVFMQGIYRFQQGQIPHVDYYMPLGLLNFALPALLTRLGFSSYASLLAAITVLAWSLAVCAYFLFRSRSMLLAMTLAGAVFAYGFAFAATGLESFAFVQRFNIHLFYNRLGFVMLLLTACIFHTVALERRAISRLEQIVLAWSALIGVYLKLSYFIAFLVLFGLWVLLQGRDVLCASMRILLPVFITLNLAIVLIYGPASLVHYYWDIAAAGQASADMRAATFINSTVYRLVDPALLKRSASLAFVGSGLAVLASVFWRSASGRRVYVWHWLFATVVAGLAIVYFAIVNSGPIEMPALLLPVFATWLYLIIRSGAGPRWLQHVLGLTAALVVVARIVAAWGSVVAIQIRLHRSTIPVVDSAR
jgi:hypothetical protein